MSDFDQWIMKKRIKQRIKRANRIWITEQIAKWVIVISLIVFFLRAIARI